MTTPVLPSHHNPYLVLVSVGIAVLASYTAFDLAGRVRASQGSSQRVWLRCAALALGTGIWAMHFIAMLAFEISLPIRYQKFWV